MILSKWVCPYCEGVLDLTIVDTSRQFICGHCGKKVSIEDEGEDAVELDEKINKRRTSRMRTVLFVVTLFSGLMAVMLAGQADEHLPRNQQFNSMAHGALCGGIGAIIAALVLSTFRNNTHVVRSAAFLAFGSVTATNLALLLNKGMSQEVPLMTQLWAISGFWTVTGSAMLIFGAKRPEVLETAPKADA